jgi:aminotransferase
MTFLNLEKRNREVLMAIHEDVLNTVSLEFSALARQKSTDGEKIISLGLGEPGFNTPPEVIDAATRSMKNGENRYSSPLGLQSLRAGIQTNLNERYKSQLDLSEKIIVTSGAKQALSHALTSILEPNDEIVVVMPSFVSFIPQVLLAEKNVKLVKFDLDQNFDLDIDLLENIFNHKTAAILINFPNNPSGSTLNNASIERLIKLCKKFGTYIISDEIYSQMIFGAEFNSFYSFLPKYDRIFVIDGFSKTYSMTGWRIGYLIGPKNHIKRISSVQQHIQTNIPVFIQRGAEAALGLGDALVAEYTNLLRDNLIFLEKELKKTNRVSFTLPKGGMFAFIDLRKVCYSSDKFCFDLLQSMSVAATPGIIFGSSFEGYIRVSIGGNIDDFREGIKRLVKFIEGYSG